MLLGHLPVDPKLCRKVSCRLALFEDNAAHEQTARINMRLSFNHCRAQTLDRDAGCKLRPTVCKGSEKSKATSNLAARFLMPRQLSVYVAQKPTPHDVQAVRYLSDSSSTCKGLESRKVAWIYVSTRSHVLRTKTFVCKQERAVKGFAPATSSVMCCLAVSPGCASMRATHCHWQSLPAQPHALAEDAGMHCSLVGSSMAG